MLLKLYMCLFCKSLKSIHGKACLDLLILNLCVLMLFLPVCQ